MNFSKTYCTFMFLFNKQLNGYYYALFSLFLTSKFNKIVNIIINLKYNFKNRKILRIQPK